MFFSSTTNNPLYCFLLCFSLSLSLSLSPPPQTPPHVGILPLGTGNDLARVLGWGAGYSHDQDISTILTDVEHAYLSLLDRYAAGAN